MPSRTVLTGSGANDPKRRFATRNCRIAKGSLDQLVGGGEQP